MKKLLVLASLFTILFTASASAQGGQGSGDPAAMKQRMIERVKPQLLEKTKITDDQANKVLDIYMEAQPLRREVRMDQAMSEEDKGKKMEAINADVTKKYKAIPLTDDQVKSVNTFFEDMRKNTPQRNSGNSGKN